MKKLILFAVIMGMTAATSFAGKVGSDDPCKALGGGSGTGGGGLPALMCSPDGPKFELASGQTYWLIGKFVGPVHGVQLFQIDLDLQPWLATAYRTNSPYYAVDLGEVTQPQMGQRVKAQVRAQIRVVSRSNADGTPGYGYQIVLQLLSNPVKANLDTGTTGSNRPR